MRIFIVTASLLSASTFAAPPSQRNVTCAPTPQSVTLRDLPEASGVAIGSGSPARLWVINDSGAPLLYSVSLDGRIAARVQVTGAALDNWEDLAAGPCPAGRCLYIADIGDNRETRKHVTIYRVAEPAPGATSTKPAEAFHARYPDGAQNAESIFVDPKGVVFIVTKGRKTKVYRLRPTTPGATTTLETIATVPNPVTRGDKGGTRDEPATGAAMSADGAWIAIRSNHGVEFFPSAPFLAGKPGAPLPLDLTNLKEPQGEGIALDGRGTLYLVSESGGRVGVMNRLSCTLPR